MVTATTEVVTPDDDYEYIDYTPGAGACWPAIIAGAVAATAISLILLMLGQGLGLSSVSPWEPIHDTAFKLTAGIAIWLVVMQWVSSALGGYLAGRLRKTYVGVDKDEVFFRDTAQGFLAWCVATLFTAAVLAGVAGAVVGTGVQATATVAAGNAAKGSDSDPATAYYVDQLYRLNPNAQVAGAPAGQTLPDVTAETGRILSYGTETGEVSSADKAYLASLVAARTGLTQAEAAARVDTTLSQAKTARDMTLKVADDARKTWAKVMLYAFLSLLIGAFIAAVGGAIGGRQRDQD
ncbi:hypothetical protein [Asticcacaulis sp. YBE204]|uniref:hypothetical protein n=1 Tax=Asticcacaulis sp. YBE204 TaxID=1282363 RepID=UPI0003C3FEF1|nr:hypothetical protein [Asticcacaulis sp. YBE204]ESQ79969.1 hypothetical protein AEYBE204_08970 [Asticcacaulis sp. YBE204]